MNKTGAWLAVHALEQLGVRFTFGIPGVHNTELHDELNNSALITPVLVTHEGGGAFTQGAVKANFKRVPLAQRGRMVGRAIKRGITG